MRRLFLLFCVVLVLTVLVGAGKEGKKKRIDGYGDYKFGLVLKDHPKLLKGWTGPVQDTVLGTYYTRKGGTFRIGTFAPKVQTQYIWVIDGQIAKYSLQAHFKSNDDKAADRKEAEGFFDAFAAMYDVEQERSAADPKMETLRLVDEDGNRLEVKWFVGLGFMITYTSPGR